MTFLTVQQLRHSLNDSNLSDVSVAIKPMTQHHEKTRHAVIWSAIDVFLRHGVQFIVSVILARLLVPEDFGLIAMLTLFVSIAAIFIDGGLSSALIQRQHATHTDESTIFYFNLIVAGFASALLCLAAPIIAAFFENVELIDLTYVLAFNLFLGAFGSIHTTLLAKEMNFRTIAKTGAFASISSGILAIIFALQGFGVWSLALQALISSAVMVVLLWIWHPWRPVLTFSTKSLRSLFSFGGYEMAANLADAFSTNLNVILIGKLFSVRDAGFYDRAQKIQQLPITVMMNIINRVAFSAFSSHSADKQRLAQGLKRAQIIAMAVNLPVLVCVIVLAEPLVLTLFGNQWLSAVPILQVLALGGLLWPLHVMNLSVLKAQGRADVFFWITILKKIVLISMIVLASFYGVMAIAWAQVASSFLAYLINAHYSRVLLGYGAVKQIRDLSSVFAASVPMAIVMILLVEWIAAPQPIKLLLIGLIGAATYLAVCKLLCKEVMDELLALARFQSASKKFKKINDGGAFNE